MISIRHFASLACIITAMMPAQAFSTCHCEFSQFPVTQAIGSPQRGPEIRRDEAEMKGYRQVLQDSAQPPNFAGHFRVSVDTCGTSVALVMIADRIDGKVQRFGCVGWWYVDQWPSLPHGIRFQKTSSLLIVSGCRESNVPCGTGYYRMHVDGTHRLICFRPFGRGIVGDPHLPKDTAPRPEL